MSHFPPEFRGLTRADLLRAVEIYLAHAYPVGELPEAVRKRLNWPICEDVAALLEQAPFERVGDAAAHERSPIYALRLGNARYPHMKLQIQPWSTRVGYMLSVNTHDDFPGLRDDQVDALAFRELQETNRTIKEAIEQEWDGQGLPTFLRYLRDYLASLDDEPPRTTALS